VDLSIPYQLMGVASLTIQLLGIIAVMSQVAWQVFIVFIPIIATCVWYQVYRLTLSEYCLINYAEKWLNHMTSQPA
jgi:ATP-binding cassette subfamily C (CFTR/MRP) protein 2